MKKIIIAFACIISVLLFSNIAMADYVSSDSGQLSGYNVTIKNKIWSSLKVASASTTFGATGLASTTHVHAYFYWIDLSTGGPGVPPETGDIYESSNGQYWAECYETIPNTSARIFYKVVSYHNASYNGGTYSHTPLTTCVQGYD